MSERVIPDDLQAAYEVAKGFEKMHGSLPLTGKLIERIADLQAKLEEKEKQLGSYALQRALAAAQMERAQRAEAELQRLRTENAALKAHGRRMDDLLRGADREETADKIFAAAQGKMNTRSVWILADELIASRSKGEEHADSPKS